MCCVCANGKKRGMDPLSTLSFSFENCVLGWGGVVIEEGAWVVIVYCVAVFVKVYIYI